MDSCLVNWMWCSRSKWIGVTVADAWKHEELVLWRSCHVVGIVVLLCVALCTASVCGRSKVDRRCSFTRSRVLPTTGSVSGCSSRS